jgi:hypothetical protein
MNFSFFSFSNSKKAMQLSINFVVVMVLGILILGFGIFFISSLTKGSDSLAGKMGADSVNMLESYLSSGDEFVVLENTISLEAGKSHVFNVGYKNILEDHASFHLDLSHGTCVDCGLGGSNDVCGTPVVVTEDVELDKHEHYMQKVMIELGDVAVGKNCVYVLNLKATPAGEDEQDYAKQIITIHTK